MFIPEENQIKQYGLSLSGQWLRTYKLLCGPIVLLDVGPYLLSHFSKLVAYMFSNKKIPPYLFKNGKLVSCMDATAGGTEVSDGITQPSCQTISGMNFTILLNRNSQQDS